MPPARFASNLNLPRGTAARADGETGNGGPKSRGEQKASERREPGRPGTDFEAAPDATENQRGNPRTEGANDQ